MKKKILSIVLTVSTSMYSAQVTIQNKTNEKVWARVNNQKRVQAIGESLGQHFGVAAAASTFGLSEIVVEPGRAMISKIGGYPNFLRIEPGKAKNLGTAILKALKEEGISPEAIRKVTFLRIVGKRTVKGTPEQLKKQVAQFAKQYGGIKFNIGFKQISYTPMDSPQESWEYKKGEKYSIQIPIVETFVYNFGRNPIRGSRILKLISWGKAIQGKEVPKIVSEERDEEGNLIDVTYETELIEIPQAAPRPVKEAALRKLIREYKELQAKRKAGTASPEELKKIDAQMSRIKKAAAAAGMAAAFIAGIAVGAAAKKSGQQTPIILQPLPEEKETPPVKLHTAREVKGAE